MAVFYGHLDVVTYLMEHVTDAAVKGEALRLSMQLRHSHVAEYLVGQGAGSAEHITIDDLYFMPALQK